MEKSARIFASINFSIEFSRTHAKEPKILSIPPKLSAANSFNNEGKLDHRLFKLFEFPSTKETYEK